MYVLMYGQVARKISATATVVCITAVFSFVTQLSSSLKTAPGGHLGIFWVGMCRPGLQISTPF